MFVGVVITPIDVTLRLYTSIVFVVVVANPSMFLNPDLVVGAEVGAVVAATVGAVVGAVVAATVGDAEVGATVVDAEGVPPEVPVATGADITFTIRLPFISSILMFFVI
jgi:hypothetical protein